MTTINELLSVLSSYIDSARRHLHLRWEAWRFDPSNAEVHEVVGALMARQVSLSTQLCMSPPTWNGHIAPIVLRTMVDNYITFAWILKDVSDRSKKFILYALGQEKLEIEHRKEYEISKGRDPEKDPILQAKSAWIDSQRFHFLTDVDVGSWSGMSTREMAEQAGCADIYHFAYTPFSAAAHSMWNHVARYNMTQCENPLHRMHRVPVDAELDMDPDYLYRSAKYVDKLFRAFDSAFGIKIEEKPSIQVLREIFDHFSEPTPESEGGQQSSESPPA